MHEARRTIGLVFSSANLAHATRAAGRCGLVVSWTAPSPAAAVHEWRRAPTTVVLLELSEASDEFCRALRDFSDLPRPPLLLAAGRASRSDVFRVARLGVDAYFESLDAVRVDCADSTDERPTMRDAARFALGRLGLSEAQRTLRFEMFRQALDREAGNRHAVARLLQIDRRYVVRILEELTLGRDGASPSSE